jgi:hypothetical protein
MDNTTEAQLASELAYTSALLQASYERLRLLEGVSPDLPFDSHTDTEEV